MDTNNTNFEDMLEGEENSSSEVYSNATVKMTKSQFSIFEIKRKHENKERQDIIIAPPYQRLEVWNPTQKSELIESILMGIPIPLFYFFETNDGKKEVVDGRQRLSCIFDFLNNKIPLKGLKILPQLNSKKFNDLDGLQQSRLEDYQIYAYIIQPPTPERVKFDIFDRVNRGGTRLTNQEMRNALYQGHATVLLEELAQNENFLQATGRSIKDTRMKDRYVILRFISFMMLENGWLENIKYTNHIDDFLAKTMTYINSLSIQDISKIKELFYRSMQFSHYYLGDDAFRFAPKIVEKRRPINMALFEAIAFFFSEIDSNDNKDIARRVNELKKDFDNSHFFEIVDNSESVRYRFDKVKELLKELKNAQ